MQEAFKYGKWICPDLFKNEDPIDVFHKEYAPREIDTPERLQNLHVIASRRFTLASNAHTVIRISADDCYKLYINGRFVCRGPAQGYWFDYNWNEEDITEYLVCGENEIVAELYYCGLINRSYNSGDRRMGMIAEVWQNGECILSTDDTWLYAVSDAYTVTHTFGYDTAFAENYDSRKKMPGLRPMCIKNSDHIFKKASTKTVSVYEKTPKIQEALPSGGVFCDFGEEITASLKISAVGRSGSRIRILAGEETDESDVRVRYDMRCNCLYEEFWTLDDGENTLVQYDYKAFRYVALVPDDGVTITGISAIVQHYPFDDGYCRLESDSALLNDIFEMCKRTVKYGAGETFVDCPTRERGQYAGDLTVSSASHVILTGDLSLFKKAIDDQIASRFVCPGLLAVTPGSFMQEFADYSLQFPILVLRYYRYTKDKEYLKKCLEICEDMLSYFKKFERDDGLLVDMFDKANLVDWPINLRDGYDFDPGSKETGRGPHNVLNAFYIGCMKQTEEMRDILGIKAEKRSPKIEEAFRRAFFRPDIGLYADSETSVHCSLHSNALCAFYGINKESQIEAITEHIMKKGFSCGVYMAYFVLKALCRMGKHREAYELIINKSEHSWYNMLKEGATTCFEAWGKDQKWNTSLCHPWATAPIPVLAEDILPKMPHLGKIVYNGEFPKR